MSELRRWSEEGATEAERALLDAARKEEPSAASRSRTLAAIGVGGGALVATTTATAGGYGVKVGLAVFVLGAVGAGAWLTRTPKPEAPRSAPMVTVSSVSAPPPVATTAASASPPPAPVEVVSAQPVTTTAPVGKPVVPPAAPSGGGLTAEVAALEKANAAVARSDGKAALAALDAYATTFPKGVLAADATVLRVRALLLLGRRAEAKTLADGYATAHPTSPYTRRLRELVE